jgi:hypothetical protein
MRQVQKEIAMNLMCAARRVKSAGFAGVLILGAAFAVQDGSELEEGQ